MLKEILSKVPETGTVMELTPKSPVVPRCLYNQPGPSWVTGSILHCQEVPATWGVNSPGG